MPWTPTAEQQDVISHDCRRHARLLAGPGTGKSATVIRMMLRASDAAAQRGKLLTFTRAATNELREKVAEHQDQFAPPSTIHSFAISVLLANEGTGRLPAPLRLADDWEWNELIRHHLKELVGCDVNTIKRARAEMASNWESLDNAEDPNLAADVRNRFAGIWEHHRSVFGYALLAELPFRLLRALEDHQDLKLGDWDFMVVDEYQDLNQCDLSVLREITKRGRTLVAVGDDDQSIYSFRRAHPSGIRRFVTDDYPEAADLSLSISQRCSTRALEWARHVIEGLPGRPKKPALTPAPHCIEGEARYLRFDNWDREVEGVARIAERLIRSDGVPAEDIAIMFRSDFNKAWSRPLMEALSRRGLPVIDADEVSDMLADKSNRRLTALARLAVTTEDSLAWWTLLHLTNGTGATTRNFFFDRASEASRTFGAQIMLDHEAGYPGMAPAAAMKVRELVTLALSQIEELNHSGANLGDAGWGTWLAGKAASVGGCQPEFLELLAELDLHVEPKEGLARFLSQIQPMGTDLRSGRAAQAIRLMMMAKSKGLTVRAAIVVGVEDGVMPLAKRDLGEERRLLYVAMTRATETLYLTWSRSRTGPTARTGSPRVASGRNRSQFLTHGPIASEDGEAYIDSIL